MNRRSLFSFLSALPFAALWSSPSNAARSPILYPGENVNLALDDARKTIRARREELGDALTAQRDADFSNIVEVESGFTPDFHFLTIRFVFGRDLEALGRVRRFFQDHLTRVAGTPAERQASSEREIDLLIAELKSTPHGRAFLAAHPLCRFQRLDSNRGRLS